MAAVALHHTTKKGPAPLEGPVPPAVGINPAGTTTHVKGITVMALSAAHRSYLLGEGVDPSFLAGQESSGSVWTDTVDGREGIVFRWNPGNGQPSSDQFRADTPGTFPDGADYPKYKAAAGPFPLWCVKQGAEDGPVLLVEGTKQSLVAAGYAPAGASVFAIAGCGNWNTRSLQALRASGRHVTVILDADMATNVQVFAMAEQLRDNLSAYKGTSVVFARIPHKTQDTTDGLDDYLKQFPAEERSEMLAGLLESATAKLPRRPKAKAPKLDDDDAAAMELFQKVGNSVKLKAVDAARRVLDGMPAAITAEKNLAVYRDGVYGIGDDSVLTATVKLLGNLYTPSLRTTITEAMRALLDLEGLRLPNRPTEPLLNTPGGMVDLRDGSMLPHDPKYMSCVQTTVSPDFGMQTPVYDAWIRQALRQESHTDDDVERLLNDLEETIGTGFDPSRAKEKMLFLFGPTRSGKSVLLELITSIIGFQNCSAESLHDLSQDKFAAANLYGKMINVCGDLSNKHVEDTSLFKRMTGRDPIKANRKYGNQFEFFCNALLAFSANEIPTVSESSRAYAARVKPFNFPTSYEGREDASLPGRLAKELPGIMAKWIAAYGRFLERGGYMATDAATRTEFEAKSDRVVQFFHDMCTLTEATYGSRLEESQCAGRRDVSKAFNAWAERNGGSRMGEKAFFQRFANITGVTEVKTGRNSRVAYNVVVAGEDDDTWDDTAQAVDPGNPWTEPTPSEPVSNPVTASEAAPAPEVQETPAEPVSTPQESAAERLFNSGLVTPDEVRASLTASAAAGEYDDPFADWSM